MDMAELYTQLFHIEDMGHHKHLEAQVLIKLEALAMVVETVRILMVT